MNTFFSFFLLFVLIGLVAVIVVPAWRKQWYKFSVAFIVGIIGFGMTESPEQKTASQPTPAATTNEQTAYLRDVHPDKARASAAPTEKPTPRISYEEQRRRDKRDFIASVDESISGGRIYGNKFKFVGKNVDLHGTVLSIIDQSSFNLGTGSVSMDDNGNVSDSTGVISVQYAEAGNLEKGQSVRVLGTVIEPVSGTNAMGAELTFAAVKAEFVE